VVDLVIIRGALDAPQECRRETEMAQDDAVVPTELRMHSLLIGAAEVLSDDPSYITIMLIVLLLLGQLAKVAL
jgi:hypothetical protein